jgi:hypothetical protein
VGISVFVEQFGIRVTLWICVREVLGQNFGLDTEVSSLRFIVVFFSSSRQIPRKYLRHDRSLPNPLPIH